MLSGLNNLTQSMNSTIKSTSGAIKSVSSAGRTAAKAVNLAERGAQYITGTPAVSQNPSRTQTPTVTTGSQQVAHETYDAPEGTCIILPPQVTANGQPRYLGAKAYESIRNLMTGGDGPNNNVVVIGPDGQPSRNVYTYNPDGTLCVRGTQTPVDIKITDDGKLAGVILSEAEYFAAGRGIQIEQQNPEVQRIKERKELGQAEDANNAGWLARNWQWLIGAGLAVAAAVTGCLLLRKQKKKTKTATNQASELKTEIASLNERVSELQSGLASSGTQVCGLSNDVSANTAIDNSR